MVNFVVQCIMEYLQHAVVAEMSMLHEVASEDGGVNVIDCVDVSITVDNTGCGLSTVIVSSVN